MSQKAAITSFLMAGAAGFVCFAAAGIAQNGVGSDVVRQQVVCRYVLAGMNPYALSKEILVAHYGAGNPNRVKISAIPQSVPAELAGRVLPEFGPPEATYPPPAAGLLAVTVGQIPTRAAVQWGWLFVNLAAFAFVLGQLQRRLPIPPRSGTAWENRHLLFAAMLLFPSCYSTFVSGQFSLLVVGLLLVAGDSKLIWSVRGAALGLALLKPSLALPFVLLPLIRREWRLLLVAFAVQAIPAGFVMARTGHGVEMFFEWLAVSRYFLQGVYTMQDWVRVLSPLEPWATPTVTLLILLGFAITTHLGRRLADSQLWALAATTAAFWTYHGPYDFVVLLPVLLPLAGWSESGEAKPWSVWGAVFIFVVAVGFAPMIYWDGQPSQLIRASRWATRLGVVGLFLREYVLVYWALLRERVAGSAATTLRFPEPAALTRAA